MYWSIYSFVDLEILMGVTVGHVLDCLLMTQVILFPQLDITLLSFQAIVFLIRI